MKQIFDIFAFTYKTGARKKAFIITTVILLVAVFLICSAPRVLIALTDGDVDRLTEGTFFTCYIFDETGKFSGCEEKLFNTVPETRFVMTELSQANEIKAQIPENSKLALIHIANNEAGIPKITLYAKDFLNGVASNSDNIGAVLSTVYASRLMTEAGIDPHMIEISQNELTCELITEGGITISGYIAGILLITLTFFAVYYYGYGVAASVASEKSTRVMETLVVSVSPSKILIGKVLGMGMLGLTQFGGILLFAALCGAILVPSDFTFMGETLSFSAFTPKSVILIIIYFILGYLLYAFMNAVSGASVDKIEDLNAAMMPVMIISMGAFYLSYFTAIMGTTYDYMVNISMYVPFSAPFIMPFVLLNGEVGTVEIVISLASLVITLFLVILLSTRIYTASVMHYGKRLKIKDALKKS